MGSQSSSSETKRDIKEKVDLHRLERVLSAVVRLHLFKLLELECTRALDHANQLLNLARRTTDSLVDYVGDSRSERRQTFGSESVGVDVALGLVKLLFVLPETARVVALEREARAGARRGNFELVDNFLPELVLSHALEAAAQYGRFKQFAKVELFAADLRHFEVIYAQVLLKLNQLLFEFATLAFLVVIVEEL